MPGGSALVLVRSLLIRSYDQFKHYSRGEFRPRQTRQLPSCGRFEGAASKLSKVTNYYHPLTFTYTAIFN